MTAVEKLVAAQEKNHSYICLGLDLDAKKMPSDYGGTLKGMFEFANQIIDATVDQVCAYKPNIAFYESLGPEGLTLLQLIVARIPEHIPIIIDAKRGDIGNTATQYANTLFDQYRADWVTINPYMGYDSMRPFLERKDRGAFVLCLTSNAGSKDFQQLKVEGRPLYMIVADRVNAWNKDHNCGLVVGATHPEQLGEIRSIAGHMPLLIPGVGAQGGSLEKAIEAGTDSFRKPAFVNVSRSVLYASNGTDFAQRARQELLKLNGIVTGLRNKHKAPAPVQAQAAVVVAPPVNNSSNQPTTTSPPNNQNQSGSPAPVQPQPSAPSTLPEPGSPPHTQPTQPTPSTSPQSPAGPQSPEAPASPTLPENDHS